VRDVSLGNSVSTARTASLLWEACRRDPHPESLRRSLEEGADLARAVAAAEEHRIGPLLWRALAAGDCLDELGPLRTALEGDADVHKMEALLLLPQAVALSVRPLTDAGLEPVVLKGPAVATHYPEPGLRPMEDIDLLLPAADHLRAIAALQSVGWQVARPARRDLYDTSLIHPDVPSLFLELHYGLEGAAQRVTDLDAEELWRCRRPFVCAGTTACGLPEAEEIVMLAAHAGKPHHGFARLVWIADLAMIAGDASAQGRSVDWERVRGVAERGSCLTVTSAALALGRHAGVRVPADLFPLPRRGWRGDTINRLVSVSWPLTHLEVPGYRLNAALADKALRRLKILLVLRASGHGIGRRARRLQGRSRQAFSESETRP
jgi:hypothetical protein